MGFNIIELGDDLWRIEGKFGSYEGSFMKILVYATSKLGFNVDEIETAITDMIEKNNDIAHFGVYKSFLFSKNSSERKIC